MKTITVAFTAMTTALLSTSAFATPNVNNCDIELNADMTLNQGVLTVLPDDDKRIVFTPEHTVSVNGNQIKLNNQQQDWANQYYSAINEAVPLTLSLTYDALDLANSAVSEAVGELLGEDDEISQDFRTLFSGLKAELDAHFYDEDGSLRIQTEDFSDEGWIANRWESHFEDRVESLISRSMGKMMMSLGAKMLSGDGEMDGFEQKMEDWGDNFEDRIDAKSAGLEENADELCDVLEKADRFEQKLNASVPELSDMDLLSVTAERGSRM